MIVIFDIGGTKTRVATSTDGETFSTPVIFATEKDFSEQVSKMNRIVRASATDEEVDIVCGGLAGPLNHGRTKLIASPNLPAWVGTSLKEELEDVFNAPVFLENDAALVALGEAVNGAGCGFSIIGYVTVSTGVGGARIVDGAIDKKHLGFEPGHQIIKFDGPKCDACTGSGHLEDYLGGAHLEKEFGIRPYEIRDKTVWEHEAELLAVGLNNIALLWSPDCIVIGGSMVTGDPGIDIARVRKHLSQILHIIPCPEIRQAELGDFGGLYGALEFVRQQKKV